jgi:TPP-dependent pyruvate/acetoin dehydrogenase alpha subunit
MRMRGHGEHDDFSYVPRELLEEYAARDPIELARRRLASEGVVSDEFFKELDAACQAEVERSYQQALSEPRPHPSTLTDGVYSDA